MGKKTFTHPPTTTQLTPPKPLSPPPPQPPPQPTNARTGRAEEEEEHAAELQPGVVRPRLPELPVRQDVVDEEVRAWWRRVVNGGGAVSALLGLGCE